MTSGVVAIIPARGGSRGVPGKNVARVGGIPLVARAVRSARAAGIDHVVVSTDDEQIAQTARAWSAELVARPAELAGDAATSESALLHALDVLADRGVRPQVLAFLQATSPFIPAAGLRDAVARVSSGDADSVFSARASGEFVWTRRGGATVPTGHDARDRPRRQDRPPQLVETGAFYVMDAAGFRAAAHRFFGRLDAQEVPAETAIEIDTPAQLEVARAIAHLEPDPADALIDVDAVVTDFDGVHTDDTVSVDQHGTESVRVSRSDGMGVRLLREAGISVLILSTERNPVVAARAAKLGVEVIHAVEDKGRALVQWAERVGVPLARIAYVGNDINDASALDLVGWPVAVPSAHPEASARARLILTRSGGDGAIRQLAELVLAARVGVSAQPEGRRR
ncbi:transferase [Microbacterium faecale]|uniref:N-acylneuraminate cytidylyltransferase n=1 Tax=Microbacterium faecale TaxID=1804630 RepID=A0A917DI24_9MICO|nr:acylneuraminate cytidylyltransferase [Microbacterium faecale]GGD39575.1 transferase [Microbacterium faecale]